MPAMLGQPSPRRVPPVVELDVRNNSLNLIRLVLAAMVLAAHCYPLGGGGQAPLFRGQTLGTWAVFCFFAISGYLITASRFANPLGDYLVKRVVRIYPAFLVCNIVTAFVFAPAVRWARGGGLHALFTAPDSPASYVLNNITLKMNVWSIGGGPKHIPYPGAWDGSLWSLYYEFWCYLIIGAIAVFAVLRRPAAIGFAFVLSVVVWANITRILAYVGGNSDLRLLGQLLPLFLGGALLQTMSSRLSLSWRGALVAAISAVALVALVDDWGIQAASPMIAYLLLWLSTVLPSPTVIKRHDISYGFYIYAFPVQQLLATMGVHKAGLVVFGLVAAAGTGVLAIASWVLVERPALELVRRSRRTTKQATGHLQPASNVSAAVAL